MAATAPGVRERLGLTAAGLRIELGGAWRLAADRAGFLRLAADSIGYRAERLPGVRASSTPRTIRFKDGTVVTYRLNRGDVRAIAEIWMGETYRLPFAIQPRNVIDMGANIGLASLWLVRNYSAPGPVRVVAAEPVPGNAALAESNLRQNGIDAEVLQAAVGATERTTRFTVDANSTLGRMGDGELEVQVLTPQTLLERFAPDERIDLIKIDVEGAEQELFGGGDLEWLDRADCLVLEIHRDRVDWRGIIGLLESRGFAYTEIGQANKYGAPTDLAAAFRRESAG